MIPLLIYVSLWFTSGYLIALLVIQYTDLPFSPIQVALFILLGSLIVLAILTSTERRRRMFYEGPGPDEDGDPLIGWLWMMTIEVTLLAGLGWVIWIIFT
jgi:hypothetical protein